MRNQMRSIRFRRRVHTCYSLRLQRFPPSVQDGVTGPLLAERDELCAELAAAQKDARDAHAARDAAAEELNQLAFRVRRLDERLLAKDTCDARQSRSKLVWLVLKTERALPVRPGRIVP